MGAMVCLDLNHVDKKVEVMCRNLANAKAFLKCFQRL